MYCARKLFNKKQQIVVLLGAGAAIPWGGTKSTDIKEHFIDCMKTKQGEQDKYIFNLLTQFYSGCANFETFLAAMEEVLNYVMSLTTEGKNESHTSFIPAIFRLKKCMIKLLSNKDENEKREYCYEIFRTYVNKLILLINNYNEKILDHNHDEINKNLRRFTKYLLNKNHAVKYYTTNYDNIIPQVMPGHCKIYEGVCGGQVYKRFKYDLELFRKARLSHFNLHGSIFLRRQFINPSCETVYDDSIFHELLCISNFENGGNPNEQLLFSPIIAGYNKIQRAANAPFSLGFNAFVNDCNDCRALCIVGYSASDPHINTILSSYINWDKVRFIYVPPQESGNFSIDFARLKDKIVQIIGEEENKSWIHNKRKHVYKNGFEAFLKDKSN